MIEVAVADLACRRRQCFKLEELQGGTFTISNGGVYGCCLDSDQPAAESGILAARDPRRPVARGGQVVIRLMMYIALTYDYRIVDGREAVTFLRDQGTIEDPSADAFEV